MVKIGRFYIEVFTTDRSALIGTDICNEYIEAVNFERKYGTGKLIPLD